MKNHTQSKIEEWIISNFNKYIPFGSTNQYMNWGNMDISTPLPHDAKWIIKPSTKEKLFPCPNSILCMNIRANGDVTLCACYDLIITQDNYLGNIAYENLIQLYNTKTAFKHYHNGYSKCQECTGRKHYSYLDEIKPYLENPLRDILVG